MTENILVEVAYATPELQKIIECEVAIGSSLIDAVKQSDIRHYFPEIELEACDYGVFGKLAPADYILAEGDRIEIYRELVADPKEIRRQRAAQGLKKNKRGVEKA